MRSIGTFRSLVLAIILASCGGPDLPILGEPAVLPTPAGNNTLGPHLAVGQSGELVMSWMRREDQGGTLRYSRLDGGSWRPADDVATDSRMFVNWADLPSVRALNDTHWVAHWLSKSAEATYAYDVLLAFSTDGGSSWHAPVRPHNDGTPTEHGFVSMRTEGDSAALLWLDGRKTISADEDDVGTTSMTLRAATVAPDGALRDEQLVDDIVCDCCQTDIAVSSIGPIAVYRDRTVDEIRDINITRSVDGAWQPGVPFSNDGWEIAGCPVNGPAIDARGDFVVVAWFSAANNVPIVRARLSSDGGASFGDPIEVAAGRNSGHVGVAIIDAATAAISWVGSDPNGGNLINVRTVSVDSAKGPVKSVGKSALKRIHPQLANSDRGLVLAWTESIDDTTRIATALVPVRMTRGR